MTSKKSDNRTIQEVAIDSLAIAKVNLLNAIYGISPKLVNKRITEQTNTIAWIFGHCVAQVDYLFSECLFGKRRMTQETAAFYAYGVSKEKIRKQPPLSFIELIELFFEILQKCQDYLKELPENAFRKPLIMHENHQSGESLFETIQRIAFHFLGHDGQIVLIRRIENNPAPSFVAGMQQASREKWLNKWQVWWDQQKDNFKE
jgi:hypothetical protein